MNRKLALTKHYSFKAHSFSALKRRRYNRVVLLLFTTPSVAVSAISLLDKYIESFPCISTEQSTGNL